VAVNFDGFSYAACVPMVDGSDELAIVPLDDVFVLLCVLDDG
jgi:hypothetical protein